MKYILFIIVLIALYLLITIKFKKYSFYISLILICIFLLLNYKTVVDVVRDYNNSGIEKQINIVTIQSLPTKHHNRFIIYDDKGELYYCNYRIDDSFSSEVQYREISKAVLIRYTPKYRTIKELKYNGESVLIKYATTEEIFLGIIFTIVIALGYLLFRAIANDINSY